MNILKRVFGKPQIIRPIVDTCIYNDNEQSYCGNSLSESNVLLILDKNQQAEYIENFLAREKCSVKKLVLDTSHQIDENEIINAGMDLIGLFQHIIMIYNVANHKESICENIYENLKIIAEYLISSNMRGNICIALVSEEKLCAEMNSTMKGIESLIKGLGYVMPKHGITVSGINADYMVPMDSVLKTSIFLSSKYGQALTGEIIQLVEEKG